jgi:hypothetical protein
LAERINERESTKRTSAKTLPKNQPGARFR